MKHHAQREISLARAHVIAAFAGGAMCVCTLSTALGQPQPPLPDGYPLKPVRVVVSNSPGGGTDIVARLVMTRMSERWNRSFVIENRASGIGGVIAITLVAHATPDGYTLLVTSGDSITNAALINKVDFDLGRALTPVAQFNSQPYILAANLALPVATVKDLIAYAKAKPGTLAFASSGTGSTGHLGLELFKSMTGTDIIHVPYKGIGPGIIDLIGGQIQLLFGSTISVMPHLKNGRLKALAVTSLKRSQAVPDIPTVTESGLAGFEMIGWYGLFAPAGTPNAVVVALNREVINILKLPEVSQRLLADGADIVTSSPQQFRADIARELDVRAKVIKSANLKL